MIYIAVAELPLPRGTNFGAYLKERGDRGSTLVKVLCYKSEGRWFDPSCQWIFL